MARDDSMYDYLPSIRFPSFGFSGERNRTEIRTDFRSARRKEKGEQLSHILFFGEKVRVCT